MTLKRIVCAMLLIHLALLQSCRNEPTQTLTPDATKGTTLPVDNSDQNADKEEYAPILDPQEETLEGYTVRYGFTAHNEDDGPNPARMEVFKGKTIVFKDAFDADGDLYITSLGNHNLDGDKLVFQLHYGTEACDYTQKARYYMMDGNGKFHYIQSYWSGTGGDLYASRYFTHIFPTDSLGKPNTLTIVEGIAYHEHDQPNVADTTHIVFTGNTFRINKLSNDLDTEE